MPKKYEVVREIVYDSYDNLRIALGVAKKLNQNFNSEIKSGRRFSVRTVEL